MPGVAYEFAGRWDSAAARGFIETKTLVRSEGIAIVTILISLTLPSLSKVKASQLETMSLSYLRSHATVFQAYTSDWKDRYPAFIVPDATVTILRTSSGRVEAIEDYFLSSWYWHLALADGYYNGDDNHPSFFPAEQTANSGGAGGPVFGYPCVFVADPAYWDMDTRLGVSQFRATGTHEVLFTSKKSLLASQWTGPSVRFLNEDRPAPMAMCDGSALTKRLFALVPGVREGDGLFPHFQSGHLYPAMHTKHGVRGVDVP